MQNVLPDVAELPNVALIPEVKVYLGQNQIRRTIGLYVENYKGSDVRTQNAFLDPAEEFLISAPVAAIVLDASAPVKLVFEYDPTGTGSGTTTFTTHNKLLIWDQKLVTLKVVNDTTAKVSVQITYVVAESP